MIVAWDVFLNGKKIETVFHGSHANPGGAKVTAEDVKHGLVNHDGYDPGIVVRKQRSMWKTPKV
jgi:hypothetical protein